MTRKKSKKRRNRKNLSKIWREYRITKQH